MLARPIQDLQWPRLDDRDLVRLRNQARTWLRADLDAWTKLAAQGKADARAGAVQLPIGAEGLRKASIDVCHFQWSKWHRWTAQERLRIADHVGVAKEQSLLRAVTPLAGRCLQTLPSFACSRFRRSRSSAFPPA